MKNILTLILLLIGINIYSQTACKVKKIMSIETFNQCNYNPWVLVFEDNFDNNYLDLSKWNTTGCRIRYCNNEQQYYTTNGNYEISNGIFKIIAKREHIYAKCVDWLPENENLYCNNGNDYRGVNGRDFYYTSANIETNKKFTFGKFEARIKIPKGRGLWPAFWMYGGNPVYNELDIFEFMNDDNDPSNLSRVHTMTTHYDDDGNGDRDQCATSYTGVDFSQDFHIFTVTWEKNKIEWFVDGVLKRTDHRYYTFLGQAYDNCVINAMDFLLLNIVYPKDPMHIILNLAVQSEINSPYVWDYFPKQMEIDWVRYYQKNPCTDINVTNPSQYPLSDIVFNDIVGKNININCDYYIPNNYQLDLVFKESITLNPGFVAESGSTFTTRIEPTVCGTSLNKSYEEEANPQDSTLNINQSLLVSNEKSNFNDFNIYPNPNNGSFKLDFCSLDYSDYSINIVNTSGNIVFFIKNINSKIIDINLNDKDKGVYTLVLLNKKTKYSITHKLILL